MNSTLTNVVAELGLSRIAPPVRRVPFSLDRAWTCTAGVNKPPSHLSNQRSHCSHHAPVTSRNEKHDRRWIDRKGGA